MFWEGRERPTRSGRLECTRRGRAIGQWAGRASTREGRCGRERGSHWSRLSNSGIEGRRGPWMETGWDWIGKARGGRVGEWARAQERKRPRSQRDRRCQSQDFMRRRRRRSRVREQSAVPSESSFGGAKPDWGLVLRRSSFRLSQEIRPPLLLRKASPSTDLQYCAAHWGPTDE